MRKTDKKVDNQLCEVLTDVCEAALKQCLGFQWLTHVANYNKFPKSLKVTCIFDTNDNVDNFIVTPGYDELMSLIQQKLLSIGIRVNNIADHISFDSEENRKRRGRK
jgi:hypothetical protein